MSLRVYPYWAKRARPDALDRHQADYGRVDVRKAVTLARRTTVAAIVVTLVACTTQSDDTSKPEKSPSPQTSVAPGDEQDDAQRAPSVAPTMAPSEDEVVTALTSAGIVILASDGSVAQAAAPPASGVSVTTDQVPVLLADAVAGSGPTGREMDGFGPTPIAAAAFLAGYARGVDTPGASSPRDCWRRRTSLIPRTWCSPPW